jgi:tripartite-type tricarboxylate transporter receptor subunit TctC
MACEPLLENDMGNIQRRHLVLGAAAAALASKGNAQDSRYPNKPIRWIVTYPPGGGTDWLVRTVAEKLRPVLGQQVIVDNRPGGGGTIGLNLLAQAPADGYTLASGDPGTITMTPYLMARLPYDSTRAFEPVTEMVTSPFFWVVNAEKVPARSFREFVALAKQSPGKVSYASWGPGSLTHVMTELLALRTGTRLLHVPYKGAAPGMQDLMSGQVDALFAESKQALDLLIPSGKVRALACSIKMRIPSAPDVPTLEEQGLTDFDVSGWQGVFAPAGTPAAVVERLNQAIREVLTSPELAREFKERAYITRATTAAQFQQEIRRSSETWGAVIKTANISIN